MNQQAKIDGHEKSFLGKSGQREFQPLQDDMEGRRNIGWKCSSTVISKMIPFSVDHLQRYARIIQEGARVHRRPGLSGWLQGEIQHYLPHEILLVIWGDFGSNLIRHEIVSISPEIRIDHSNLARLSPLFTNLHSCWVKRDKTPFTLDITASGLLFEGWRLQSSMSEALQGMRAFLLHGIRDERGPHDCLYMLFSSRNEFNGCSLAAMEILLPCLDTAWRRIGPPPSHFPLQTGALPKAADTFIPLPLTHPDRQLPPTNE